MWGRIISTHALTEGDGIVSGLASTGAFQLTPSWRATKTDCSCNSSGHISTHALTEGDRLFSDVFLWINISTHALTEGDDQLFCNAEFSLISTHALTEGDRKRHGDVETLYAFQLTPSRRATADIFCRFLRQKISTHALTEGDCLCLHSSNFSVSFQLTPARRATPSFVMYSANFHFNSRPHGGRHVAEIKAFRCEGISTHALTEGDYEESGIL